MANANALPIERPRWRPPIARRLRGVTVLNWVMNGFHATGGVCGRAMALGLLAMALLVMGGCFGYNNVESIDGASGFENPNSPPVPQAMATALQWVALRYPPGIDRLEVGAREIRPDITVNFPVGARRDTCEYVCQNTGVWACPLTRETQGLPVYHIARVWTRGLYATVDIFRPATQLGAAGGGQVLYQCITVQLRSGIGSYSVYTHRVWPIGSFEVPGLHFLAPGHDGRTQPAPDERSGRLPPLQGETRTPATGAPNLHTAPVPDETPVPAGESPPIDLAPEKPESPSTGG